MCTRMCVYYVVIIENVPSHAKCSVTFSTYLPHGDVFSLRANHCASPVSFISLRTVLRSLSVCCATIFVICIHVWYPHDMKMKYLFIFF